jgi:hypothetical protein
MRESYTRVSGLSPVQLEEIEAAQRRWASEGHTIRCGGLALESGTVASSDLRPSLSLSKPAQTLDGRFAVVRVNVVRGSLDAIGYECLAGRRQEGWGRLRCDILWVS